jgi:hypothetical protein
MNTIGNVNPNYNQQCEQCELARNALIYTKEMFLI